MYLFTHIHDRTGYDEKKKHRITSEPTDPAMRRFPSKARVGDRVTAAGAAFLHHFFCLARKDHASVWV